METKQSCWISQPLESFPIPNITISIGLHLNSKLFYSKLRLLNTIQPQMKTMRILVRPVISWGHFNSHHQLSLNSINSSNQWTRNLSFVFKFSKHSSLQVKIRNLSPSLEKCKINLRLTKSEKSSIFLRRILAHLRDN